MDKNTKQMKAIRAKQEEAALNRVLCWLVGGSVLEFLLLLLNRYYNHYTVSQIDLRIALGTAVKVLAVAALVGALACGAWWNSARKSGKSTTIPGALGLFLAGGSVSCFATWFFAGAGLKLMYLAVPAAIVLAFIYYLYQREFFLVAAMSAEALLGVWVCARALGGKYAPVAYVYLLVAAVDLVCALLSCRKAQGDNGKVTFRGRTILTLSRDANYALLYASAVIALATLAAAVLSVPTTILLAVLVAWLLIMAVYYTVKLI